MEVDFPRGKGAKKKERTGFKKPLKRKREKNLFMTEKSKPRIKKRKVEKLDIDDGKKRKMLGSVDIHTSIRVEHLTSKTVCPGLTMLGYISAIQDYKMMVSLSNNMKGVVPITEISDTYTNKLQQLADSQVDGDEDVPGLNEMFKVGMVVICKKAEEKRTKNKNILELTINPRLVYENKTTKFLKNNTLMCGSVVSEEDHGYIIDIGICNITGFLPKKHTYQYIEKTNEGDSLIVGQLLWCRVMVKDDQDLSKDGIHTVHLNIDPEVIANTTIDVEVPVTYFHLLPGVNVTVTVKKSTDHGLVVRAGNKICVVHPTHVNGNADSFKEDQEVEVKVLYVHPENKTVYLTTLPHLVNYNGTITETNLHSFSVGDMINNAVVCESNKIGIYMKLPHGATGFAQKGNLSDSAVENIGDKFPIGSKHNCRVLGFSAIDNFVMLSLRKSVLEKEFVKIKDIVPGSKFKVKVKYVKDTVVGVNIGDFKGIIPAMHMADIPLKNPHKRFAEGDELECRVLKVAVKENKVTLTNKKSLVNTTLPIIHDFNQIKRSMEMEGFIAMINDKGVLVVFYNDIKGWVPKRELSEETIEHPDKVFYIGQVVRCTVIDIDDQAQKFFLSLKKDRGIVRDPVLRSTTIPDSYEAGKIIQCKVESKGKGFLTVVDLATQEKVTLYKTHLADFDDLCDVLWTKLQEGDVLGRVMHFIYKHKIIVTMKPSLITQTESDIIPNSFSDLSKDMILTAVVKNIVEYGIFFTITGGLSGLVPMKVASDNFLSYEEMTKHLHIGQTIVVRITFLDIEKQTFVGSMLTKHCFPPRAANKASQLMKLYLENRDMVESVLTNSTASKEFLSKITEIPVGSVINVIVQDVAEDGYTCQMANGLTAFVTRELAYDRLPQVGEKILGVVVSVDLLKSRLDLSLDQNIITAMKSSETENQVQQLNVNESIPAIVLHSNPVHYLVSLRSKAMGSMAYVPTKYTINCINEQDLYPVRHKLYVKIHSVYNENLIALTDLEKRESTVNVTAKKNEPFLSIGGVYTATVVKKHPSTIDLKIQNINKEYSGILHCTDVLDTLENGIHPFDQYEEGSKIMVRVVQFTKQKGKEEKIAECLTKPSQLKGKMPKVNRSFPCRSIRNVFISKVTNENASVFISTKKTGLISRFDLSDDLNVLENPSNYFKKGQGFNAEVVGCQGRRKILFSLTGHKEEKAFEGQTTKGYIRKIDTTSNELNIVLPVSYKAVVKLDNSDVVKYHVGQWLWCEVLTVDKNTKQCTINIKTSRGWRENKLV